MLHKTLSSSFICKTVRLWHLWAIKCFVRSWTELPCLNTPEKVFVTRTGNTNLSPVTADNASCFDAPWPWLSINARAADFSRCTYSAAVLSISLGSRRDCLICTYKQRRQRAYTERNWIFEQTPSPCCLKVVCKKRGHDIFLAAYGEILIQPSNLQASRGVAKAGPDRAHAQPKHHAHPTHAMQSCMKHAWALVLLYSLELAYSSCPANTNDLATLLNEACSKVCVCCCYITSKPAFFSGGLCM